MFQGDTSTNASPTNVLVMMRQFQNAPEDGESEEVSEGMGSLSLSCSQESVVESVASSESLSAPPSAPTSCAPAQTFSLIKDLKSNKKPSTSTKQVTASSYSLQHRQHKDHALVDLNINSARIFLGVNFRWISDHHIITPLTITIIRNVSLYHPLQKKKKSCTSSCDSVRKSDSAVKTSSAPGVCMVQVGSSTHFICKLIGFLKSEWM